MPHDRDAELLARLGALHEALLRRNRLEERIRSGLPLEADLLDSSLAAAEAVLTARAALYRHLIDAGWTPPETIVKDLEYDEIVLSEPDGAVHG